MRTFTETNSVLFGTMVGGYFFDYSGGQVIATISSQSRNAFSMKLDFKKVDGTILQPDRVVRASQIVTDGSVVQAQPAVDAGNFVKCPDGTAEDMRSSCAIRSLEGNERLSGHFENDRKVMTLNGLVHPMGRCTINIKTN